VLLFVVSTLTTAAAAYQSAMAAATATVPGVGVLRVVDPNGGGAVQLFESS
jgi:hypothetical protein